MKTATGTTLITNGQIIDGTGAPPIPDAALVVKDDRIAYAGPAAGAPQVPAEARRIDAQGGTIEVGDSPAGGARVRISLPARGGAVKRGAPDPTAP